jgi:hypothetical protein
VREPCVHAPRRCRRDPGRRRRARHPASCLYAVSGVRGHRVRRSCGEVRYRVARTPNRPGLSSRSRSPGSCHPSDTALPLLSGQSPLHVRQRCACARVAWARAGWLPPLQRPCLDPRSRRRTRQVRTPARGCERWSAKERENDGPAKKVMRGPGPVPDRRIVFRKSAVSTPVCQCGNRHISPTCTIRQAACTAD